MALFAHKKNEILEFRADGPAVGEANAKKISMDVIEKAVTWGAYSKSVGNF